MTMRMFIFSLGCLLVSVLPVSCQQDSELLFVQILFRHGDRAPAYIYPNDPNPESFWEEGLGMLTKLGRQQHYALGNFLKSMYANFITSNPNEIHVLSSPTDRCVKSALSNVASFYAPSPRWRFEEDLDWQPISVWHIPQHEDKFLTMESYCPRAIEEQERVLNSPQIQEFIAEHQEMIEVIERESGTRMTDWLSAVLLYDTLFIEKKYNLTVPEWATQYWNEMQFVNNRAFFWIFNSNLLQRLRSGPLLGKIIGLMQKKIAGDIPLEKIQMYSAHDTSVAGMLNALNVFNGIRPPYCAALLFELHRMGGGRPAVRLLYLNSSNPETGTQTPHVLTLRGCSEFCPLDQFVRSTKSIIPDNWEKECQMKKKSPWDWVKDIYRRIFPGRFPWQNEPGRRKG